DAVTGEPRGTLKGHALSPAALAFSPDGRRLASAASADNASPREVKLWDVASVRQQADLSGDRRDCCIAFSPDGRNLVAVGPRRNGEAEAPPGELATARQRLLPVKLRGTVTAGGLSPDGRLLALAYQLPTEQGPAAIGVRVWDRAGGREVAHLRGHADVIAC